MTTFEKQLRDRLAKLDEIYRQHRAALITTLQYEADSFPEPVKVSNQLDVVMEAAKQLPSGFNKDAVKAKLEEYEWRENVTDNTLKNIANHLWKLSKEGRIKTMTKGKGRRQSTYEVIPAP